jgi:hypothetical protein
MRFFLPVFYFSQFKIYKAIISSVILHVSFCGFGDESLRLVEAGTILTD